MIAVGDQVALCGAAATLRVKQTAQGDGPCAILPIIESFGIAGGCEIAIQIGGLTPILIARRKRDFRVAQSVVESLAEGLRRDVIVCAGNADPQPRPGGIEFGYRQGRAQTGRRITEHLEQRRSGSPQRPGQGKRGIIAQLCSVAGGQRGAQAQFASGQIGAPGKQAGGKALGNRGQIAGGHGLGLGLIIGLPIQQRGQRLERFGARLDQLSLRGLLRSDGLFGIAQIEPRYRACLILPLHQFKQSVNIAQAILPQRDLFIGIAQFPPRLDRGADQREAGVGQIGGAGLGFPFCGVDLGVQFAKQVDFPGCAERGGAGIAPNTACGQRLGGCGSAAGRNAGQQSLPSQRRRHPRLFQRQPRRRQIGIARQHILHQPGQCGIGKFIPPWAAAAGRARSSHRKTRIGGQHRRLIMRARQRCAAAGCHQRGGQQHAHEPARGKDRISHGSVSR